MKNKVLLFVGLFLTISSSLEAQCSVTVSPGSATTCVGAGGITLTASGATNYLWIPSSSLSNGSGSITVANPSVTTTYSVLGSTGTCTSIAVVTITVSPPPTITVTPTNTIVCYGMPQNYTATGMGVGGTYTWFPNFNLSCSVCPNPVASPSVTTTFTITGNSSLGCLSLPRIVTLSVVPVPTATVSLQTNTLSNLTNTICGNQAATLSVSAPPPLSGLSYSYTWSPTTGIITSQNSATILAVPSMSACQNSYLRTYSCTISYASIQSCKSAPDTTTIRVINCFAPCTWVNEIPNKISSKIYPNPFASHLNLEFISRFSGKITVFDYLGRTAFTDLFMDEKKLIIDLSDHKSGIYFIKLQFTTEYDEFFKVVKE